MKRSYPLFFLLLACVCFLAPTDTVFAQDEVNKDLNGQEYDTNPKPLKMPPPEYPAQAKADSVEGMVVLALTIETDGSTSDVSVQRSLRSDLDTAALVAVRQIVWEPARLNGEPVKLRVAFPVRFKIRPESEQ